MKNTTKQIFSEAFEAVCSSWEQRMKEFIIQLSDGSIPALRNAEWIVKKSAFSHVRQISMEGKGTARVDRILIPLFH